MKKLLSLLFILAFAFEVFAVAKSLTSTRNVYTVTPVTTVTPLTLVASLANSVSSVSVFDSSGQTMKLIITTGSNIDTLIIPPGGGDFRIGIAAGALIQLQAISATANAGESNINFIY